ncbi:MAG TPA: cation:proton antiporter [Bryobacteraceae bacterium]|jgi:Kef-type K+ transport system membrane component KefB|nr:cation:proton antiporter [Bryobacteraceae bacterium]
MTLLLLQMTVVLLVTTACGWIARRIGQARVIGEIIGGIVIGPSVLGRFAPGVFNHLFTKATAATFDSLSTIGLLIFLFLIGMELDYEQLYKRRGMALMASGMSIVLPFGLAVLLAHSIRIRFAPQGIGSTPFVLFLGIAMSITAFPVLARILEERGIQSTALGTTSLLCAAVDDVVAWLLLAFALAFIGETEGPASLTIRMIGLVAYLIFMLFIVRPLANWLMKRQSTAGLSIERLAIVIAYILLSAAATDAIGVHPLFGAFLAGVCFPRVPLWHAALRTRLDMLVSVLLLPLFFALTGLRTRLDLLSGGRMWLWAGIILIASIAGKMGGAALAARWSGQSWKEAVALGALLNTRGLVELIVLNIAYNAGVFSPTLFTMLVVMALVTTILTTPILNALGIDNRGKEGVDMSIVAPEVADPAA